MNDSPKDQPESSSTERRRAFKLRTYGPDPEEIEKKRQLRRKQQQTDQYKKVKSGSLRVVVLTVLVAAAALFAVYSQVALRAQIQKQMPTELLGNWRSKDARFEGRQLEIRIDSITFVLSDGESDQYRVRAVRTKPAERGQLFAVESVDRDGFESAHIFLYSKAFGGTLQLQNRPDVVWWRSP